MVESEVMSCGWCIFLVICSSLGKPLIWNDTWHWKTTRAIQRPEYDKYRQKKRTEKPVGLRLS